MNASTKRFLTAWVKKHPHGWNHDDWEGLLVQLEEKGYQHVPDQVGQYIEGKHQIYFGF